MSGKLSKNKGSNYERTIAKKFKEFYNVELTRTPQSGGFAKKSEKADDFRGDIVSVNKDVDLLLHIEVKNHKNWALPSWIKQAESDSPNNKIPVVIFHQHNTSNDYVTIKLEDFFKIVSRKEIIKESEGEK